jgi:hypothetical protein
MSEEDRIDEIIRSMSADYNRPPVTPRDDMWAAIQAAQNAPGPRLHVTAGGASSVKAAAYSNNNRFGTRYAWFGMAAAAVLLVATGVGIGRYSSKPAVGTIREPGVRVYASNPQDFSGGTNNNEEVPSSPEPAAQSPSNSGTSNSGTSNNGTSTTTQQSKPRTREDILRSPKFVGQGTARPLTPAGASNQFASANNAAYNVATAQHLANAEVLLTAFTLKPRDQQMDAQFSQWARGLLANTRLLLDSPAGDDPRRAKLLQDLEQVLAQIVQLSPNAAASDRELIQGSIQQGQVITRLRTIVPGSER